MDSPFVATPSFGIRAADRTVASPDRVPMGRHGAPAAGETAPQTVRDRPSTAGGRMSMAAQCGPLAPYVAADGVTDIVVNGETGLWIDRGDGLERDPSWTRGESELRALAIRLIAAGGRHIDEANPCVDVRLPGGIRVHAVLAPVSTAGTLLSVRVPRRGATTLAALQADGMFGTGDAVVRLLHDAVARRRNVLITGAAGSGKTTLLAAMLGEAEEGDRILAIEDVAELVVRHPHFISLESRQANLEGAGAIGLERLLREALRMRPDRLILGECRGGEIRELLAALNTGHDGGGGTLHANSLDDVPARLEALGALAGMTASAVARQAVSALELVLHLERTGSRRRLAQIGRFALTAEGALTVVDAMPDRPSAESGRR